MKTIEDNGPEPAYRPGDRVRQPHLCGTVATIVRAVGKACWGVWEYEIEYDDLRPGLPTTTFGNLVEPLGPAQKKGKPMATPLPDSVARGTAVVFAKPDSFRGETIAAGTPATYDDPSDRSFDPFVLLFDGTRLIADRRCLALPGDATQEPSAAKPLAPGDWIESGCDNFGAEPGLPGNLPRGGRTRVERVAGDRFSVAAFEFPVMLDAEGRRWKRCDPPPPDEPKRPPDPVSAKPVPETRKPEPEKDTTMNPIEIKTVTLVNGAEAKNYSTGDRSRLLACVEQEVKRLEGLEFKTQETKDEIAALRASAVAAIAEFDKEYAERKAAERKAAAK